MTKVSQSHVGLPRRSPTQDWETLVIHASLTLLIKRSEQSEKKRSTDFPELHTSIGNLSYFFLTDASMKSRKIGASLRRCKKVGAPAPFIWVGYSQP